MNDITTIDKNVETAALRTMDDVYRQTLNRVQLEMATGSMSINQAVDMAVKDFLEQGINCIVYKDGKHVNIADYVRMALRTTSTRATLQGKASRFAELGYDTVLVSEYGMCSETCLPWQGRVYIDDVFTDWDGEKDGDYGISKYCGKRFPLLSSAMRGGLFHPNCRHSISLWIEGHSKLPEPMDAEKIKERSKAEQKQRALEREVRRHKREVVGLSDEAAVRLAKQKLKQAQAKLKAHIDEHDFLRRDYGREKIYDTPHSSAADQQLNAPETLPNVQTEGHTAEVEVPAPELNYPADSKTYVDEKIPEKSVDISGESGIIESEEVNALEQAKKRDHKIEITEMAINKVGFVKPYDFSDEQAEAMKRKHQEILKVSMTKNDCNEVLFIDDVNFKSEVQILGDENSVSPAKNPFAVSIIINAQRQSLIYMHNHPSTQNFSIADIDTFICESAIKIMTVVTNQGKVYLLNKRHDYDYNKARKVMVDVFNSFNGSKIDNSEFVKRFIKNCRNGGVEYEES